MVAGVRCILQIPGDLTGITIAGRIRNVAVKGIIGDQATVQVDGKTEVSMIVLVTVSVFVLLQEVIGA